MAEARAWTDEQLKSEAVTKKQIIQFLQEKSSSEFLKARKMGGKLESVVKGTNKDDAIKAYNELFDTKSFRDEAAEKAEQEKQQHKDETKVKAKVVAQAADKVKEEIKKEAEKPRYTKTIIKAGDGKQFPRKGDHVTCRYKGMLPDGKVFDQNMEKVKGKEINALLFKVGTGKVIRGWDEALLMMTVGEVATLVIQPEWAYGKKGMPEAGIAPNTALTFELSLEAIN